MESKRMATTTGPLTGNCIAAVYTNIQAGNRTNAKNFFVYASRVLHALRHDDHSKSGLGEGTLAPKLFLSRRVGGTLSSKKLGKYHSADHPPWVAVSPVHGERQGVHPEFQRHVKQAEIGCDFDFFFNCQTPF
uniref:Uncharacterized protein n=1 Tax=Eutreptiella gymnastica TaxID=73025 RepID=A0A7S1J3M1_9EUGL